MAPKEWNFGHIVSIDFRIPSIAGGSVQPLQVSKFSPHSLCSPCGAMIPALWYLCCLWILHGVHFGVASGNESMVDGDTVCRSAGGSICPLRPRSQGADLLQRRVEVSEASVAAKTSKFQKFQKSQLVRLSDSTSLCQGECVIPAGERLLLDTSWQVETLTIYGTLEWDRSKDNLELRANYILVEDGGHFILGTVDSPMNLAATVYITKGIHSDPELGRRFLGGRGTGQKLS